MEILLKLLKKIKVNFNYKMETNKTQERLKKRLKKRQEEKTGIPVLDDKKDDIDIFQMISQVQNLLKTNPGLVNKISGCVNNLMGDQELMKKFTQEIQKNDQKDSDSQTLVTSTSGDNSEAVSK